MQHLYPIYNFESLVGEYYRIVQMFCVVKQKNEKKGQKMDLDCNDESKSKSAMVLNITISSDQV